MQVEWDYNVTSSDPLPTIDYLLNYITVPFKVREKIGNAIGDMPEHPKIKGKISLQTFALLFFRYLSFLCKSYNESLKPSKSG